MTVHDAVPVADARAELGESPLWDDDVGLRWLDIPGRRLLTRTSDGEVMSVALSARVSAVELTAMGKLLAVIAGGFGLLDPDTGDVRQFAATCDGEDVTMNDGAVDARGRCWAGSAVRDGSWAGALYRLDGSAVSRQAGGIGMSNGIDWSPAGDVLYHADSNAGTVRAWDYDLMTGELGDSRVLLSVTADVGLPDGLTVDAEGYVWLAVWGTGQVWRLTPDTGETAAVVDVPTPYTTSCAFGGHDLGTLYVTTANHQEPAGGGLLYAAEVPARGSRPHRFAGAT